MAQPLVLKRAPVGDNQRVVVGHIFFLNAVGPQGPPGCGRAGTTAPSTAWHTATRRHGRLQWRRSPRVGAEVRDSPSLARSSSSASRYFSLARVALSECPARPMSINLTPYRIRGIAHSLHCSSKLIPAATEGSCPIADLAFFAEVDAGPIWCALAFEIVRHASSFHLDIHCG
jgi:hypothetical protein